jgi:hypothetical protein
MSYARQLLDTYPSTLNADAGVLAATIDALSDCTEACIAAHGALPGLRAGLPPLRASLPGAAWRPEIALLTALENSPLAQLATRA